MVRSWMLTRGVLGKYTGRLREKCCSGGVREERGWWEGNWGIFFKVSRFWIARSWMLIRGVVKIYEKSLWGKQVLGRRSRGVLVEGNWGRTLGGIWALHVVRWWLLIWGRLRIWKKAMSGREVHRDLCEGIHGRARSRRVRWSGEACGRVLGGEWALCVVRWWMLTWGRLRIWKAGAACCWTSEVSQRHERASH